MSASPPPSLLDRPERALAALIAAQVAFWTLAPALSYSSPPLDVVEMYAWGREGVVATFKHPNGPGLLLEGLRRLTGHVGWPAYLLSQICIGVTFWAAFALGRELMDARRALAGALLLTGVYFFSWVTPEFNHNVLQMPLWALTILFLWRGTTRGHWADWALLGLFAGLGMWAKYSHLVLLAAAALWLLWDVQARRKLLTPGPWMGLLVFAGVAAPQALWLTQNDFLPFEYAARRGSDGGPLPTIEFVLTQVLNHLPLALLLLCAGFFGKPVNGAPAAPEARAMRFLWLMGLGPLVLTALAGMLGMGLRASWGAPMFSLSGLIVVALLSARFDAARLKRLGTGAGVLIVLVSGLYFGHARFGALITNDPLRGNAPESAITRAMERQWRDETGAPLRIVAGDIWTAGLVGLSAAQPPSVLINGDFSISPWVSRSRAADKGVLVVWQEGQTPNADLAALIGDALPQRATFPYRDFPDAPPLVLNYVIVAPTR